MSLDYVKPMWKAAPIQVPKVQFTLEDGIAVVQMVLAKKGYVIPQHAHEYDHVSMLAVGSVNLYRDGVFGGTYKAPTPIKIDKGVKHMFEALEDGVVVYCIHNVSRTGDIEVREEHRLEGVN